MIDVSKITAFTTLNLGRVGENEFRPQQIDISAWLTAWPGATVSAVFSRPDGQLYTVVTDVTTSPLTWTPGTADLAVAGDGKLELRIITADGVVGKSAIIRTVTHDSLGATGEPPTPPAPDWTETVAENATEARTAATDAQTAAQAASDAQQAINTAEPDRVLAEQGRASAESVRASAESDRAIAESNRSTAESGRQTAENNRVTAEQNRVTAEANRVTAEANRVSTESTRVTAESDRNSAEITRGQNESTRQSNESTRQSNESARVSAENTRAAFYSGFSTSISTLSGNVSANTASISELSAKNTTSVSTKNLFNPNSITVGYYVSYVDGTVAVSSTLSYTDYISVAASTAYVNNKRCRMIAYYDSNKAFISGVQNISVNISFKTPSTAAFMRITLYNTDISAGSVQIESGNLTTDYEPYYVLNPNKVGTNAVSGNCIKDGSLSWRKSKYLTCGKNLFNKAAATQGYYVNFTNGVLVPSSVFYSSEYIPVTAGVTYTRNIAYGSAFYDANFQFISGIENSEITFTAPANAAYLRASITTSTIDHLQIEVGSTSTEFENFYISLSPSYFNQTESVINLPTKLYGVIGHELNIYFDNIVEDASAYKINVICASGSQYADRWTFTPTTAGTITLSIELRKNNQLIATASTSIVIVAATAGASATRKCLFIGDSTTAAGTYTGEMQALAAADSMTVTLLGTQGTSPNLYEAYGGWGIGNFVASGSPFYISGALNFSAYMSAHGYSSVDRIVINLGINDIFAYLTDDSLAKAMATAITKINSLITSIRAFSSTVPIGIAITIPPSYSQDAFAASYQSGQTRWRYKRNLILWDKLLISTFGGQETSYIYLVPIHTNLDTKNNMQTATINANSRNATQITVQNNGVHPAQSGYYQIADAMYYWLKSFEI